MYGVCLKCGHEFKLRNLAYLKGRRCRMCGTTAERIKLVSNEEYKKNYAPKRLPAPERKRVSPKITMNKPIKKPVRVIDVPEDKPETKIDEIIKAGRAEEEQKEFWRELEPEDPEGFKEFYIRERVRVAKKAGMSRGGVVDYIVELDGISKEIAQKIVDFLWK